MLFQSSRFLQQRPGNAVKCKETWFSRWPQAGGASKEGSARPADKVLQMLLLWIHPENVKKILIMTVS